MTILLTFIRDHLAKKQSLENVFHLYLGNTVSAIGGFLVVIILANALNQNDYGNYKYVFSIVGILSVLSFTGSFRNLTIQSTAKGFDGILSYLFKRNLQLSFPMLLGGLVVSIYYFFNDNNFLGWAILLATFTTVLGNNSILAYGYVNGRKKYKEIFYLQSIQSVVTVLTLFITTLFTQQLLTIFCVSVLTSAIIATAFVIFVRKKWVRNNDTNPELLRYGKHLNILGVISTIMMHIDSILIFKVIGSHGLAIYALATPFVDRLTGFLKTTYFFVLPKFTEQGHLKARTHLVKRSLAGLCLGLVVFALYYVTAPILFELFFPAYLESVNLSRLFALNLPIIALSILPDAFLDSLIEAKNKYIVKATTSGTRIITLLIFIFPFGVAGVIWSELLARLVGFFTTTFLIHKYLKKEKANQKIDS